MKHFLGIIVFSVLFLTISSQLCIAQFRLGVKGGLNVSYMRFDKENEDILPRYNIGFLTNTNLNQHFYLQNELLYSIKGYSFNSGYWSLGYLSLPILLGYRVNDKFSFLAGIELNYLLNVQMKTNRFGKTNYTSGFKEKWDQGINLGIAYQVNSRIIIDSRFTFGLNKIFDKHKLIFNTDTQTYNAITDGKVGFNRLAQLSLIYLLTKK